MSLALAQERFSRGRHADAAPLFRQALASTPALEAALLGHAGCLLHGKGPRAALPWLDRCLAIKDDSSLVLQNAIGLARQADDPARLIRYLTSEIAHRPVGDLLFLRGETWQRLGSPLGAARDYKAALALAPGHAGAACNLGALLTGAGEPHQATGVLLRGIATNPSVPPLRLNLAYAALKTGAIELSLDHARAALAYRPDWPEAFVNRAIALDAARSPDDATAHYARALAIDPLQGEAYAGQAKRLIDLGRHEAARSKLRIALALAPHLDWTHANQATASMATNDRAEVERSALRALALDDRCALAEWALALMLLSRGDYPRGWARFESRWRLPEFWAQYGRRLPFPLWDGGDARDRRILLWTEQGFGDAIHFVRYAPLLAARGARVVLECPAPLARLFQSLPGIERVVTRGEPLPEVECHAPLMSLPHLFGTTLASIPAAVPYLAPPPGVRTHPDLDKPGFRIGLVWAGSPGHKSDRTRSLGASDIRSLVEGLAGTGASLFSLQVGPRAADLAGTPVTDLTATFRDFADTAAAIAKLDLVIAVDTAVAHLAGALAKTLLVLIPHAAEWRWRDEGIETPWYPSARLLRQNRPEDWSGPIERAAEIAGSMRSPG